MPRSSIVAALTLVAAACFHDNAPRPGDTAAATTGTTGAATGSTTGATTTAASVTGDDASTLAPTGSSTSGLTGDGDDDGDETGTMTDPNGPTGPTSATTGATATTADTTGPDDPDCAAIPEYLGCIECCGAAEPGSSTYFAALAECECNNNNLCLSACKDSLCSGVYPTTECFECVAKDMRAGCSNAALEACMKDPSCTQFIACVLNAGCQSKQ